MSESGSRVLLGLLLIEMGVISDRQLEQALAVQQKNGELLGEILVAGGYSSRLAIQEALARQAGLLLEPERGYGTGLRAKLVQQEELPVWSCAGLEESEASVAVQAESLPCDVVAPGWRCDRARPGLLDEQRRRIVELESELEDALSGRASFEASLRKREVRLQEVESDLEAVRNDLKPARRYAAEADDSIDPEDGTEDFPAVVGRAKRHLAARRASLRTQEQRLVSDNVQTSGHAVLQSPGQPGPTVLGARLDRRRVTQR